MDRGGVFFLENCYQGFFAFWKTVDGVEGELERTEREEGYLI